MICQRCKGERFIKGECFKLVYNKPRRAIDKIAKSFQEPCPDCGGTGIQHCCEGDRCSEE